eukprot:CAMPEP_0167754366 /NCGR_PEP_ID=MMETSP0110_2-20121227/8228_1 /TAXON_ID=629695 /ORGANISM="Gymnochlora sp., Strain CCMP2014" /LENGTH=514 /DNA_ID=CAMNT_0007640233 /DNA_START=439 /DNA_END=1983 /DNA_ORIENTATION=+
MRKRAELENKVEEFTGKLSQNQKLEVETFAKLLLESANYARQTIVTTTTQLSEVRKDDFVPGLVDIARTARSKANPQSFDAAIEGANALDAKIQTGSWRIVGFPSSGMLSSVPNLGLGTLYLDVNDNGVRLRLEGGPAPLSLVGITESGEGLTDQDKLHFRLDKKKLNPLLSFMLPKAFTLTTKYSDDKFSVASFAEYGKGAKDGEATLLLLERSEKKTELPKRVRTRAALRTSTNTASIVKPNVASVRPTANQKSKSTFELRREKLLLRAKTTTRGAVNEFKSAQKESMDILERSKKARARAFAEEAAKMQEASRVRELQITKEKEEASKKLQKIVEPIEKEELKVPDVDFIKKAAEIVQERYTPKRPPSFFSPATANEFYEAKTRRSAIELSKNRILEKLEQRPFKSNPSQINEERSIPPLMNGKPSPKSRTPKPMKSSSSQTKSGNRRSSPKRKRKISKKTKPDEKKKYPPVVNTAIQKASQVQDDIKKVRATLKRVRSARERIRRKLNQS